MKNKQREEKKERDKMETLQGFKLLLFFVDVYDAFFFSNPKLTPACRTNAFDSLAILPLESGAVNKPDEHHSNSEHSKSLTCGAAQFHLGARSPDHNQRLRGLSQGTRKTQCDRDSDYNRLPVGQLLDTQ